MTGLAVKRTHQTITIQHHQQGETMRRTIKFLVCAGFFAAIGITVAIQTILFIASRVLGLVWLGLGAGDWMSQFVLATAFDLSLLAVIVLLQFAIGRKLRLLATQ